MPSTRRPRKGSLQYWPRKRAKREYARVRSWAQISDAKPLGFAGYKVGMTHAIITDNRKTSQTKGEDVFCPITVIECPPIKTFSVRFYKKTVDGFRVCSELLADNLDKELERKITMPKSQKSKKSKISEGLENSKNFQSKRKAKEPEEFDCITLLVHTQPKLTGIGKRKPEIFEIELGGKKEDKLPFAKNILGKEINVKDVFKEGQQIDIHGVTKGKGVKGPVKRFGISLKSHKSEKSRRVPGSLGPWCGQGKIMWKVANAGQTGYHQRTEYNKWLIKISDKPEGINPKGGFLRYGVIKSNYILIKGSIMGPKKRAIIFCEPTRPNKLIPQEAPVINLKWN